jgi:hypothetical protein
MPIPTRARTFALGGYVTGHGFVAAPPPVEVTETRSSLLDFVLRFLLHRVHIIYISQN